MNYEQNKYLKKRYLKKISWIVGLAVLLFIFGIHELNNNNNNNIESSSIAKNKTKKTHLKKKISTKKTNSIKLEPKSELSTKTEDEFSQPEHSEEDELNKETEITETPYVSTEFISALEAANFYSNNLHMSKSGVFDQLISEYGDKFSPEAAQYAVDSIDIDWSENALETAKYYQTDLSMSLEEIRDQLTSDYGEKFTDSEANYAINNLY